MQSTALLGALAVPVALALDRYCGEPPLRWHPVVWMGRFLEAGGGWVQRQARQHPEPTPDYKAFWYAALVWTSGAALVLIAAMALQWGLVALATRLSEAGSSLGLWPAGLLLGLLLKPLLAWALLRSEVEAVEAALGQSLPAGRERLRYLVSRDVAGLSETAVRESAIETLAENLNDSVVAPIFWFVLLGLPGAALFRFANTADAMWGYPGVYQGRNWAWAGKWAARADDVLGWLPARITAALLMGSGAGQGLRRLPQEAARTVSPNSGWPMAAMALLLGIQLAKPGGYVLNAGARSATQADTRLALDHASNAVLALMGTVIVAIIFIATWELS